MATKGNITHSGTIINIFRDSVTVAVESSEACGSCTSRNACSLGSQSNTRNILITTDRADRYTIGQSVVVSTRTQMGLMAAALCYAVPALVLIVALIVATTLLTNQGVAALISLGAVVLYYFVLWLCRDKLAQKISFTIQQE